MSDPERLTVFVGTWNVGNIAPGPAGEFGKWIEQGQDIYAFGAQECGYEPREPHSSCESDWVDRLASSLGSGYYKVTSLTISPLISEELASSSMRPSQFVKAMRAGLTQEGQIRLVIFAKEVHRSKIHNIESSMKTTGRIEGVSGNKGAVAIAFDVLDTRLCFVNAHLNAHLELLQRRNEDCWNINKGLRMGQTDYDAINQSPYVFWLGDLNYRIELSAKESIDHVHKENWSELLLQDQLHLQQQHGRALSPFREMDIRFAPTFKCIVNDPDFRYDEKRAPAYCDRILFRAVDGHSIRPIFYRSVPELCSSDHKPVGAAFEIAAESAPSRAQPESNYQLVLSDVWVENLSAVSNVSASTAAYTRKPSQQQQQAADSSKSPSPAPSPNMSELKLKVFAALCVSEGGSPSVSSAETAAISSSSFMSTECFTATWPSSVAVDCRSMSEGFIRSRHVIVGIREDGDEGVRCGEALLPRLASSSPSRQEFCVPLYQYGIPCGVLHGHLNLAN